MPRQVIKIMPGDELKVKIEDMEEFEDSIFVDVYARAARSVKDIVDTNKHKDKSEDIMDKCEKHLVKYHIKSKDVYKDNHDHSNIIAFAGGRGTGKTSAMISVAKALKNINIVEEFAFEDLKYLSGYKFSGIDTIDPSMLENNESIFEIVIARMFDAFKNQVKDSEKEMEREERREVLQAFQEVFASLKTLHSSTKQRYSADRGSDTVLEELSQLASGSNIRSSFRKLVNKYLEFIHKDEKGNHSFLLVTIDDLDMNIKAAEAMLEQIRKYMNIPNVIILMAVKIEQLIDAVEQEISKNFIILRESKKELDDKSREMAIKYLEKLIPEDRTLHLPELRINANDFYLAIGEKEFKEYEDLDKKLDISKEQPEDKDAKDNIKKYRVQDKILGMTYRTFGLLFTIPDNGIHYLVPETLRQLHNYVSLINKCMHVNEDTTKKNNKEKLVEEDTKTKDKREKEEREKITRVQKRNLPRFKEYFLHYWIDNNIFSEKNRKTIHQFYRENINIKNKSFLFSEYKEKHDISMKRTVEKCEEEEALDHILNKRNLPENISFGDVLFCLNDEMEDVEFRFEMEERRKFIFCVKTLYSILLHEIINIEKDMDRAVSIICGSIVNLETISSLPRERERDINRNNFEFDYKQLYAQKKNVDFPQPKNFRWIHFFLYLGKFDLDELRQEDIYYEQSASGCTYAVFSIWAFAFYLLKPSLIKSRLDDIEAEENSLYDEIEMWKEENQTNTIFPIFSIDFLEDLFKEVKVAVKKKLKKSAKGYFGHFEYFVDAIRESIEKICEKNSFMPKKENVFEFVEVFNNCPLIKKCKEPQTKILLDLIDKHPTFTVELEDFLEKYRDEIKPLRASKTITDTINKFNEQAKKRDYDIFQETQHFSKKMEDKNYLAKEAKSDFLSILDKHLRKE